MPTSSDTRGVTGQTVNYFCPFVKGAAFLILNSLSRNYVLPEIRTWEARSQATKYIEGARLFSLLAVKHPEIREQVTRLFVDLARKGATTEEAYVAGIAFGRQLVEPYFAQYAPYASDEALINFFSLYLSLLEQLKERQDDACFVCLLPTSPRESRFSIAYSPPY